MSNNVDLKIIPINLHLNEVINILLRIHLVPEWERIKREDAASNPIPTKPICPNMPANLVLYKDINIINKTVNRKIIVELRVPPKVYLQNADIKLKLVADANPIATQEIMFYGEDTVLPGINTSRYHIKQSKGIIHHIIYTPIPLPASVKRYKFVITYITDKELHLCMEQEHEIIYDMHILPGMNTFGINGSLTNTIPLDFSHSFKVCRGAKEKEEYNCKSSNKKVLRAEFDAQKKLIC
ncbi:MAG: hypothetical protein EXX96DRAFT_539706 [Benjaminiella poitrasii]|nr:MAG: hypothetical protein EXX96DRAFT_539706 [Benjaminiella poitrasii]